MKKFLAFILIVVAAIMTPCMSFAVAPELKEAQGEINAQCPMKLGDGITLEKIVFTDDNSMELHIISSDLAGYTEDSMTEAHRKVFRESFGESLSKDNPLVQLCKALNLKMVLVIYNPAGQRVFRETFQPSDF